MFGSLGDMMGMIGSLGKLNKEKDAMQEELKTQRVEGCAGGEQVKVTMNGLSEVLDIKISPELVQGGDVELLEDLVRGAFASATEQTRELANEQMKKMLENLPLGPLKGLLGGQGE